MQIAKIATGSNAENALMTHQMSLAKITLKYKAGVVTTKNYTWNTSTNTANITNSGTTNLMASNVFSTSAPYVTPYYYNTESNQEIYYFIAKYNEKPQLLDNDATEYKKWSSAITIQNNSKNPLGKGIYATFTATSRAENRAWCYYVADFPYQGKYQQFTTPIAGQYRFECWGAQGGSLGNSYSHPQGGYGGYARGALSNVAESSIFYVYVGQMGQINLLSRSFNGGGGAAKDDNGCCQGGGATDIRIVSAGNDWANSSSIQSRIIVAGGGAGSERNSVAGAAGGLSSYDSNNIEADIATQLTGYRLGVGENADLSTTASGGGGGYWGGITGGQVGWNSSGKQLSSAGGSSFISGHNGCRAIQSVVVKTRTILDNYSHSSVQENYDVVTFSSSSIYTHEDVSYEFKDTKMIDGAGYAWTTGKGSLEKMPTVSGSYYDSGKGHSGNGYARITFVSE